MPRLPSERRTKELHARTVSQFYGDTAAVLSDSVGALDVYGQPSTVTTTTSNIACSFTDKPSMEKWQNFSDIAQIEAEIRYSGTPAPAKGNRVTLKGRFDGTGYTDTTYEIVGIQDRDNLGVVCALKKVSL